MDSPIFGLVAGEGRLPLALARGARRRGLRVAAVGLCGLTDAALEGEVEALRWIHVGELGALIETLREAGVRDAVLAGKLPKSTNLFRAGDEVRIDARMQRVLRGLADFGDDSIMKGIADSLLEGGIRLRPQAELVPDLLAGEGTLGAVSPTASQRADIAFGWPIAKAIGGIGVGQTVVVKDRAVMALEAIEGTDAAIRRGCALAGAGACVVKVAKPGQDPRFDLPTVGPETLRSLVEGGALALAVEAHATFVLDREAFVGEADARGIALVGVRAEGPAPQASS